METEKKESITNPLVKAIHENVNVQPNLDEMGENDIFWVKENKGFQTADIKFPTFEDNNMELELRQDISFEHLTDDINSIIELLIYFEKEFIHLLSSNNKEKILRIFAKYSLNHINFIAYSVLSRRQITLLFYVVKLKYDGPNDNLMKAINVEFKNVDADKIVEEIATLISSLDVKKDHELFSEVANLVKKNLDSEEQILSVECKPSIVGISIAMKFFKALVQKTIADMTKLRVEIIEEVIIDFLHAVH